MAPSCSRSQQRDATPTRVDTGLIALIPILILAVFPFMAYAAGRLARGKGHPFWLWFTIGFVLGPVCVLIAYLVSRAQDTRATASVVE
jgi:hypothetical protein